MPRGCIPGAGAEQIARTLEAFERAEELLIDVLGQAHPEGTSAWDPARWEELLDHVASLHARMVLLRARLDHLEERSGRHGPYSGSGTSTP